MIKFRFQDLEIWKDAITLVDQLFDIADSLEEKRRFKLAEQLRAAALSMPNNIAEGSGSFSKKDFANFLNFARRSSFENANILIVFERRGWVIPSKLDELLDALDHLGRKITKFQKTLLA